MTSDLEHNDLPRFAELEADYEILRELGRGGTAVVYLARERQLGRKVAIKVIRATYIEDDEAAARLEREARTIASLQHPNIVMLYGTRRLRDKSLALIMQYLPGRTLKSEVLAFGPLPFDRVTHILTDLANALSCAQQHRIVHRDIKPENIYLDYATGMARLSDFGLARPWDSDQGLTLPGAALGTPSYMSPEQIDGGELDARSDLYSLGMVGYHMLTGHAPWAGESLFNIIYKQKHEALPPLDELRPGIPHALQYAIEGTLFKNRTERWVDAQEFLMVLSGRMSREFPPASGFLGVRVEPGSRDAFAQRIVPPVPAPVPAVPAPAPVPAPYRPSAVRVVEYDETQDALRQTAAIVKHEFSITPASSASPSRGRRAVLAAAIPVLLLGSGLIFKSTRGDGEGGLPGDAFAAQMQTKAASPAASAVTDRRPARASQHGGDHQVGVAGDTLAQPLMVQVQNAAREPIPGVMVQFAVRAGESVVLPRSVRTDETGVARVRWLLREPGTHSLIATVNDLPGDTTIFIARALKRPPSRVVAVSPAEVKITPGSTAPVPIVIKVNDDRGNPVSGVDVRFVVRVGTGRVNPSAAQTAEDGTARTEWQIGTDGPQELLAGVLGVPSARILFRTPAAPAPPPALAIRRGIAVGGTHTCSLSESGEASCWGGNAKGQLGAGAAGQRGGQTRVDLPEPLSSLSAGVSHTCGIAVSGSVLCWGANSAGQLGDGTRSDRTQPVKVTTEEAVTRVFTGMSHSCGLSASGRLFCWGLNSSGQLGDGSRADRAQPVAVAGGRAFRTVALGWAHSCALTTEGAAFCWGRNSSGELGDGTTSDRSEPVAVNGGARFSAIAAGSGHTCALTPTGTVMCWGQNAFGQLGNQTTANSPVPVEVQPTDFFSAIALGSVHSCALARDGSARCWGRNTYGQLGDGTNENQLSPTPVVGGLRFSALDASGAHTCGTAGGTVYCWGYNSEGQLGNGSRVNQSRPVAVQRQ